MSETITQPLVSQSQQKLHDSRTAAVKQEPHSTITTTTPGRRMSKTQDSMTDHRVLSNIENKENSTMAQPIKETTTTTSKPDNHYIKNKNMQSPVSKNKVNLAYS